MIEIKFRQTNDMPADATQVIVADHLPTSADNGLLKPEEMSLLEALVDRTKDQDKDKKSFSIQTLTHRIVWYVADKADDYTDLGGKLEMMLSKDSAVVIFCLTAEQAYQTALGMTLRAYCFDKYITKEDKKTADRKHIVCFVAESADDSGYAPYAAVASGVTLARDLTNEPSNYMTPVILAERVRELSALGIEVDILDQDQMRAQNFNLALSVAQGSSNPPRVAVMRWKGKPESQSFDIGLVGKGVTFDSGGISIKPAQGMWDMKQDMAGAAAVIGAFEVAALQKLPINAVGVVGLVENMPSGTATRPGDIVRSMSGQTVEILNTDAEGRLVLADCLWYIQQQFDVKKVVDIATLTGAIIVTLGHEMAGLMSNDQGFADSLMQASKESSEKLWQLPITKAFDKLMDSSTADMKNIGEGRQAGSITAACFLNRFIRKGVTWAHLDIAGMDKEEKGTPLTPKGASGFGVRLFNALMRRL